MEHQVQSTRAGAGDGSSHPDRDEKEAVELFHRWTHGERGVWNSLVALCAAGVRTRLSTILGDDIEDVLQDTLIKLLASANRFRGESIHELYAYSLAAALHEAYAELRRRKRLRARIVPLDEYEDIPEPGEEYIVGNEALVACIEEAIRRLPPRKQHLIARYYEHNSTAGEIAKASGIRETTTRSRIRLALAALEQLMFDVAGAAMLDTPRRHSGAPGKKS